MPTYAGVSVIFQCPQGSVAGQYNLPVVSGSIRSVRESIGPDESVVIPFDPGTDALVIQTDYECQVKLVFKDEFEESGLRTETVVLRGQNRQSKPLVMLADLSNVDFNLDGLDSVTVHNVSPKILDVKAVVGKTE